MQIELIDRFGIAVHRDNVVGEWLAEPRESAGVAADVPDERPLLAATVLFDKLLLKGKDHKVK